MKNIEIRMRPSCEKDVREVCMYLLKKCVDREKTLPTIEENDSKTRTTS